MRFNNSTSCVCVFGTCSLFSSPFLLQWCSQFPGEEEILFAPLTGLEVMGIPRVDERTVVVELRLNTNLHDLTIEQVRLRACLCVCTRACCVCVHTCLLRVSMPVCPCLCMR